MVLTLNLSYLNERAGRQSARAGQDGAGYRDLIVPSKTLNHSRRSVFDRRQPGAEFGFYTSFNAGDEMTQDIVEYLDLVFA